MRKKTLVNANIWLLILILHWHKLLLTKEIDNLAWVLSVFVDWFKFDILQIPYTLTPKQTCQFYVCMLHSRFEDVKDEIFDMVHPKDPLRITLQDLIDCGNGDTVVSILIDLNGFWTYENREVSIVNDEPDTS